MKLKSKVKSILKTRIKLNKVEVEILKKEVKDESSESLSETRTDPSDVLEPVTDKVSLSGSYTYREILLFLRKQGYQKKTKLALDWQK